FGVLALQADLIDNNQFAEACSAWTRRKHTPLADLLIERGWILPADQAHLDYLLERKLKKYGGDAKASLATVADNVKRSIAALGDPEIQRSLAELRSPERAPGVDTVDQVPQPHQRYLLTRLHATGGIGRIWLAHDCELDRDVALKELRSEQADKVALCTRFV